ncbi:unnamed protein product [Dicrocoelium dendriticum]|nr:unnamed protein product [Dicrocoelium dendriticum]
MNVACVFECAAAFLIVCYRQEFEHKRLMSLRWIALSGYQKLATRMIESQRGKSYEDRLSSLGLFSLERRRLRGDLIETLKIIKGLSGISSTHLFELAMSDRLRGHRLKLKHHRVRLDIRTKFFTNRVVNFWNKLPSDLVESETVEAFKRGLDDCWSINFPEILQLYWNM